jgi:hypothetical protein
MTTEQTQMSKRAKRKASLVVLSALPLLTFGGYVLAGGKFSYYVIHGYEAVTSLFQSDLPDAVYTLRLDDEDGSSGDLGFTVSEGSMTAGYVDLDSVRYFIRADHLAIEGLSFRILDQGMQLIGTLNGSIAEGHGVFIYTSIFRKSEPRRLCYVMVEGPGALLPH